MKLKPIEIFCGTGGVGKTTIATSRALYLASKNHRVLLITIDPAKRLKQVLKMQDTQAGEISSISGSIFGYNEGVQFDALLMSPSHTIKRMAQKEGSTEDFNNRIIKILSRPYGGMNEILAIIEVQYHLKNGGYDSIILDTPPGKHFLDFLQSTQKIRQFFDKTFIDIFKVLGKNLNETKAPGFINLLVKTGVKKLLGHLEKVTGESFVEEFIDAIAGLYRNKDSFLQSLDFGESLKDINISHWFLVVSAEQQKSEEAGQLQNNANLFMHSDSFLIINKCLSHYLQDWLPGPQEKELIKLKSSMLERENKLKTIQRTNFKRTFEFPDVLGLGPSDHVKELSHAWGKTLQ